MVQESHEIQAVTRLETIPLLQSTPGGTRALTLGYATSEQGDKGVDTFISVHWPPTLRKKKKANHNSWSFNYILLCSQEWERRWLITSANESH